MNRSSSATKARSFSATGSARGRGQHALRPIRAKNPHRQRLEPRESRGELLQGAAHAGGDDGEHDAPFPRHALQLQQVPRPSLRALDAGSVLPDLRVFRAGGFEEGSGERQARRSPERRSRAPSRSTRSSYDKAEGEVKHDRTGQVTAPDFPFPAKFELKQDESNAPRTTRRVDHVAGQSILRAQLREPDVGLPHRRGLHRSARRHSRGQSAVESRAAATG